MSMMREFELARVSIAARAEAAAIVDGRRAWLAALTDNR